MLKNKYLPIIGLAAILGLSILPMTVHAEDSSAEDTETERGTNSRNLEDRLEERQKKIQDRRELIEQRKEELGEKRLERTTERETIMAKRCDNRGTRIDNKINMFETSEKFHQDQFNRIVTRLENLRTRLAENDYDTTTLDNDIKGLKDRIAVVDEKFKTLVAKLEEIKALPCPTLKPTDTTDDTETENDTDKAKFNNSLQEAKDAIKEVRDAANEVRRFFKETVKPDLEKIIGQIKEDRETAEDKPAKIKLNRGNGNAVGTTSPINDDNEESDN